MKAALVSDVYTPREVALSSDYQYLECLAWPRPSVLYEPPIPPGATWEIRYGAEGHPQTGAYRRAFAAQKPDDALKKILSGIGVLTKGELASERASASRLARLRI